jgi:hypothetical protein
MMGIVSEKFLKLVQDIGMDDLTRPIFYNSPGFVVKKSQVKAN